MFRKKPYQTLCKMKFLPFLNKFRKKHNNTKRQKMNSKKSVSISSKSQLDFINPGMNKSNKKWETRNFLIWTVKKTSMRCKTNNKNSTIQNNSKSANQTVFSTKKSSIIHTTQVKNTVTSIICPQTIQKTPVLSISTMKRVLKENQEIIKTYWFMIAGRIMN